jgi:hypothetical protein
VSCAASKQVDDIGKVSQAGEYLQNFKMIAIEMSTGRDASAYGRLGSLFAITSSVSTWSTSVANGQTGDVTFVNVGAPLVGSLLGGTVGGFAGGPLGGLGGSFLGDRLGGYAANRYEKLRGQYCK